jgi:hypothetical protein
VVTARPWAAKSKGALSLIDWSDSASAPPEAFATVVIVMLVTVSIAEGDENDDAPFDWVLFVTT